MMATVATATADANEDCHATLLDGRRVTLRVALPADQSIVDAFCVLLGTGSVDARRIATLDVGTVGQRRRLLERASDHATLLAIPTGADAPVVGIATYRAVPDDESCEVWVAVDARWQTVGLGSLLVEAVVQRARSEGFRHFYVEMLGGNLRMLSLLRETLAHDVFTRVSHGAVRVDFDVA